MPAPIFLIRKRLQSKRILSRIHHKKPSRNPRRNQLLLFNWGLFARAWPGLNTPSGKLLDISCISATSKEEQVANAGQCWPVATQPRSRPFPPVMSCQCCFDQTPNETWPKIFNMYTASISGGREHTLRQFFLGLLKREFYFLGSFTLDDHRLYINQRVVAISLISDPDW